MSALLIQLRTKFAGGADYTKLMDEWAVCGGPKPRYRWLGVRIHSLPYWAGIVYTAGAPCTAPARLNVKSPALTNLVYLPTWLLCSVVDYHGYYTRLS